MEQYDVYSSKVGLSDTTVSLPRNHSKLKRDKDDFIDDGIKLPAVKVPRQSFLSVDNVSVANHSDPGAMSVLPRLLRTMTNGSCRESPGHLATCNIGTSSSVAGSMTTSSPTSTTGGVENGALAAAAGVSANPDTDSSSSASSYISPPSSCSNSSLISFLSPGGQLGSVASAMAAAAVLSTPGTTATSNITSSHNHNNGLNISAPVPISGHEAAESGLVTLATASSLIEQEWLARVAFSSSTSASSMGDMNQATSTSASCTDTTTTNVSAVPIPNSSPRPTTDVVTLTVEHGGTDPIGSSSPPLLFKTLTSTHSPQTQLSASGATTPVTRAVLDFHSFAAFIRETQKQCSSRSTPTTPLELPLNSVFPVPGTVATSEPNQVSLPCGGDTRSCSPSHITYASGSAVTGTLSSVPQNTQPVSGEALLISDAVPTDGHNATVESGPTNSQTSTAFISLQPAAGSILSSSDLQQLMASGEFMSSAARQTLLSQPSDGSTRQLYLLVPSDCPVIMSRSSGNPGGSTTLTSASSPLLNSTVATSAPILEAISPGVEPDDSCDTLPPILSHNHASTSQSVHVALPAQLAGAVLAPMSSATTTALSTLIAGLEVRSQASQQTRYTNPVTAPLTWSTNSERTNVQTTDSVLPTSPRVRLPLNIPGVTVSEPGHFLSTDQSSTYTTASTINGVSSLLGAIKSDPDMYTPNGHPYASLVEDVTRFRSYPTYTQTTTHQVPIASGRAAPIPAVSSTGSANALFFQPDLSASLLLPSAQSTLVSTAVGSDGATTDTDGNANPGGGTGTNANNGGHLIQSSNLTRTNPTFQAVVAPSSAASSGASSATNVATASPSNLVASSNKSNGQSEDCRRALLAVAAAAASNVTSTVGGRVDAGPPTFLEHLNPESKDIRRRVSHNEVERRRRDRINTWISELYKLLPPDEQAKSQYQSKGVVLKRVCEYFQNVDSMLKAANAAVEQTRVENGLLRQRVLDLEQENQLLSASLQLGAAAAAVQLRHRQPRSSGLLHSEDASVNGSSSVESIAGIKDPVDPVAGSTDYPNAVTLFTVGANADYGTGNPNASNNSASPGITTFAQAPISVHVSLNSSSGFTGTNINNNGVSATNPSSSAETSTTAVTTVFVSTSSATSGPLLLNSNTGRSHTLTLPSLDMVANHSDTRTE